MVERGLSLPIRKDLKWLLGLIVKADICKEDRHYLLLLWAKVRDDIKEVENKHNG